MKKNTIDWDLLVRYLNGRALESDHKKIAEWLRKDANNGEYLAFLKRVWENPIEEQHHWDAESSWQRFTGKYGMPEAGTEMPASEMAPNASGLSDPVSPATGRTGGAKVFRRKSFPENGWYRWAAVAASLVIIVTATFVVRDYEQVPQVPEDTIEYREIATEYGHRTHLRLSDGSTIVLNAGSTLKMPESFNGNGYYEVHLSGEAYFDIAHNPGRTFLVYTELSVTEVLGTSFIVKSYPDDNEVQVVVSEGSVSLKDRGLSGNHKRTISKNQIGILHGDGRSSIEEVKNMAVYMGWLDGKRVFDNDPLAKVFNELQRWYNIEIEVDSDFPQLMEKEITATFYERQPVREILEAIALTHNVRIETSNGVYRFSEH